MDNINRRALRVLLGSQEEHEEQIGQPTLQLATWRHEALTPAVSEGP